MNLLKSIKQIAPHLSNTQIRELIKQGKVSKNLKLPPEYLITKLAPNKKLDCELIKMTEDFIFLSKPSGLPSVALSFSEKNSVANWLLSIDPKLGDVSSPLESGLAHRLDNETSGLMLAARNKEAWQYLRQNWEYVKKEYTCLTSDHPPEPGLYEAWFPPKNRNSKKVTLNAGQRSDDDKLVQTEILRINSPQPPYLITIQLITGCRHQIRAHLAQMDCPIIGDILYGGLPADRLYLHSSRISFTDASGKIWDVCDDSQKLNVKSKNGSSF